MPQDFFKKTCPYCHTEECEADWVDVGVGLMQCGPFHCHACGATEISGCADHRPSPEEAALGWYSPSSPNLPATLSTINGQYVPNDQALSMYRLGLVEKIPFQVTWSTAQLVELTRKTLFKKT